MKQIVIDNKKFRYNKDKPISKTLQVKLNQVKNTNEYRSYSNNKIELGLRVKNALTKHAIRNKFRVSDLASAFKSYTNSIKLVNRHFEGEQGLQMIAHYKSKLRDFLKANRNMKINIRTEGLFTKPEYNDSGDVVGETEELRNLPSTYKTIRNEDELDNALEASVKEILLMGEKLQVSRSNFKFQRIISITIHYDKYDPTRAGSYIELPEFIKLKKACVNIKNKDNKCFKYCIQSVVLNKLNKNHPEEMYHYNKLHDDIINWNNVNFPTGIKDIERFEANNDGLISINVYEPDGILSEEKVINVKTTKIRNAKYHIDLLRVNNEDNKAHYALVKNISRLLSMQLNKNSRPKHLCRHCRHPFFIREAFERTL